jgi:ubiquitin C-terminal hydrolase
MLHGMQNRISKKPAYEEHKDIPGEAETDKADRLWQKYLSIDNSPITDLFGGQLQSTVHCQKCKGNFTMYEPFWDLSLPIVKEGKGGIGAWLSGKKDPTSIQDCLQAFTSDELLQVMVHLLLCIAQAHSSMDAQHQSLAEVVSIRCMLMLLLLRSVHPVRRVQCSLRALPNIVE